MTWENMLQDPFFYVGVVVFLGNLVSYYTLLDKISGNIKSKKKEDMQEVEKELNSKKLKPQSVVTVMETHEHYENLQNKINTVFNSGMALGIISLTSSFRNFLPDIITSDLISILIISMIIAGAMFSINGYQVLRWNLNNK